MFDSEPRGVLRADTRSSARRSSSPAASHRSPQRAVLAEFQRSRLLRAAMEEASERGRDATTVATIVARARVSRKTFYESFESRDDCFAVLFEESVAQVAAVVAPAYGRTGSWSERLRNALIAVLELLESDPDLGALVLTQLVADASPPIQMRARVLERLRSVIEEGCPPPARSRAQLSPLAAELVVGGVLAVIHARLQARPRNLSGLANQLMWMIVLPYLGPAAAGRELRRTPPRSTAKPPKSASDVLGGLDMRMTYRTAKVLTAIAEQPGASNVQLAASVGVTDQGQISKLLARLSRLELIENIGPHSAGAANAWRLTLKGGELDAALRRRLLTSGSRPLRRRGA